ncbi:hypothetical protein VC83_08480 [Pseudogymnoascus destructans]|uniref:Uncharacterized protein n=2 Tax=Pseudogymnoascus destructans TaxID=655981 RepID=L8G1D1_PSED2|nr:uncharacterized protein VC83_08480 [Pseudogymnoascus destructans]ELR07075.1 hypothetical protein GMDG_08252 [Pseudogymnoascus destructans 20631-21]OAF55121.1 hypothetical protein VC83_08480 [Pseudogymnoascus destructans]
MVSEARAEVNINEPSIETLQALLLLSLSFIALGSEKKAYMLLGESDLESEWPWLSKRIRLLRARFGDHEGRRRINALSGIIDGRFDPQTRIGPLDDNSNLGSASRQDRSNLQYHAGSGKTSQGGTGLLFDIVRILGNTSLYLAAGGVKGDSHFPCHSLSNLSKIRQAAQLEQQGL